MRIKPALITVILIGALAGGLIYLMMRDVSEAQAALHDYCIDLLEKPPAGYQAVQDDVDCTDWATATMHRVQGLVLNCHHLGQGGYVRFEQCLLLQDLIPPGIMRSRN